MRPTGGFAELHVGCVRGSSAVLRSRARSPMCLLTPQPRGPSVWACTSSLGGGMVAGDEIALSVELDENARCYLGTQSSTKVYRNPRKKRCSQSLTAKLGADSLLVLLPDPVQCFAESIYEQRQTFDLAPDANLILLDWFSAGRVARGERWQFERYRSRNEIRRGGRPVLIDALELNARAVTNKFCSGRFNCLATLVISGPLLSADSRRSLEEIGREPIRPGYPVVMSASPLSDGALIRLAAISTAEVGRVLSRHLGFITSLLSENPWRRKW